MSRVKKISSPDYTKLSVLFKNDNNIPFTKRKAVL